MLHDATHCLFITAYIFVEVGYTCELEMNERFGLFYFVSQIKEKKSKNNIFAGSTSSLQHHFDIHRGALFAVVMTLSHFVWE